MKFPPHLPLSLTLVLTLILLPLAPVVAQKKSGTGKQQTQPEIPAIQPPQPLLRMRILRHDSPRFRSQLKSLNRSHGR